MLPADRRHVPAATSATPSATWLIGVVFVVVFGFCAICAYVLYEMRRATWERAVEVAASLATAIGNDVSRNVETLDLSLRGVVDNLRHPDIDRIAPDLRQLVLFDRSATARHLGTILVLDEAGNIRIDSRTLNPPRLNLADRDYFRAHKDNPAIGLYISDPQIARLTGRWFIGVSRRLSHSDGSFAGVVMASLRLSYFQQLFKSVAIGANGNVTLFKTDGTVVMRWPYKKEFIGLDLSKAALFHHLGHARAGHFETAAATDGLHRQFAYRQIADLPLVISVGQLTDDIYANWRHAAVVIGVLVVALCAIAFWLALYLARELRRRRKAEMKFAALAMNDALTGLANRRHFNEVLDREWRRCKRDGVPIALLMIDTDLFKSYNDSHGHQTGDALLQTIGGAIAGTIKRGSDFGARYGGDEFAILLSGTSTAEAERVAEMLRQKFSELCQQEGVVESGLSIGISSITPRDGEDYGALVRAADEALYRAKHLGRNCTQIAVVDPAGIGPVLPPDLHRAA
jgi:diguanylate cyclase (GGDEF)-like protein